MEAGRKNRIKIFAVISTVIFLIILILSNIVYIISSNLMTKKATSFFKEQLYQTSYSVHFLTEYAFSLSMQFYFDPGMSDILFSNKFDWYEYSKIQKSIEYSRISTAFIHSIYIYNANNHTFYISFPSSQESIQFSENFFDKEIYDAVTNFADYSENYGYRDNSLLMVRNLDMSAINRANERVYTIVFKNALKHTPDSCIILNIAPEWLQQNVAAMSTNYDENVFAIDKNGNTVLGNKYLEIATSQANHAAMEKIINNKKSSDYFIFDENGTKYLYTFQKIENPEWIFISKLPYNKIIGEISNLKSNMIIAAFVLLVIGIIATVIISNLLNKPYNKIYAQIQSLEEYNDSVKDTIRSNFIKTFVMHGNQSNINNFISQSGEYEITIDFNKPYILVLFYIGWFAQYKKKYKFQERKKQKEEMLLFASEMVNTLYKCDVFTLPGRCMGMIISTESVNDETIEKQITDILDKTLKGINDNYSWEISALFSEPIDDFSKIQIIYNSLEEDLWYMKIYGYPKVIAHSQIKKLKPAQDYVYPVNKEKIIIDCMKTGSGKETAIKTYHDMIDEVLEYTYEAHKYCLLNLMFTVHKTIMKISANPNFTVYFDIKNYLENLDLYETLYEIINRFESLMNDVFNQQKVKKGSKQEMTIEKIKQIVEADYVNKILNINLIASKLDMSPVYLSRIFRLTTQETFTEYLNRIRLEKACTILQDKKVSAVKIADMTGFNSNSYFSRLFKKQYGVTPKEFRNSLEKTSQ